MTAFKKPLCSILAIVLVFVFVAAAPISVFAEDEEVTLSAQEIELNKKPTVIMNTSRLKQVLR